MAVVLEELGELKETDTVWAKLTIGDLGRIVTGKTPSSKFPEFFGEDYPFITPSDINDSSCFVQTERYLSEAGKDKQKSLLLPSGTVCFTCIGATIGKICLTNRASFTNQQINSVIVDQSRHDNRFVYYLLREVTPRIRAKASGAATPIINKSSFSDVEVYVPPLPTQQKIAAVLSAYDDLIENNLRRIKLLEEMAQALYREWFVHFRYPGHEHVPLVDSPLGPIPQGWEVKPIGEVIETLGGGTPSSKNEEYWDGDVIWYSPTDLTSSNAMFIENSSKKITQLGLQKSSAKMFPAYSVMMTSRATVGVVSINTAPACTNQGFITCVPNETLSAFYLYFWIHETKDKILSLASGATFKEINKTNFRNIEIIIPPSEIQEQYLKNVVPICKLIENLLQKTQNLRQTRDLLLPRLISGQLDVSDLEVV